MAVAETEVSCNGNGSIASDWMNLVGADGKVKARLNRATGELVIKERNQYHRWPVFSFLRSSGTHRHK